MQNTNIMLTVYVGNTIGNTAIIFNSTNCNQLEDIT